MELEINDYKLIEFVGVKDQRRLYKFKCKVCGHEKVMQMAEFKRNKNIHSYKSCGEDFYKTLKGKQFGDYIVLSSNNGIHKNHKLKEDWGEFCRFVEGLPYAKEFIMG